jgi:hypothetical protein
MIGAAKIMIHGPAIIPHRAVAATVCKCQLQLRQMFRPEVLRTPSLIFSQPRLTGLSSPAIELGRFRRLLNSDHERVTLAEGFFEPIQYTQ